MTFPLMLAAACVALFATRMTAQDNQTFVTRTCQEIRMPDGGSPEDFQAVLKQYYDNVIAKSTLVIGHTVERHAWGSHGATICMSNEFATWEDIEKFNMVETEALEKAAWPDEKVREAFLDKMDSYLSPYHQDEIYSSWNDYRKTPVKK